MFKLGLAGILVVVGLSGCTPAGRPDSGTALPEIDGMPDDAVWAQVPPRTLRQPLDRKKAGRILEEGGTVRFFQADGILYLSAGFEDSFLVSVGEKDGDNLYHGDCFEIFIKPAGKPFYWEIWFSPDGLRSVATWRKRGGLESQGALLSGREIQLATTVRGTLGNGKADDVSWGLEAAVPLPEVPGKESGAWEILVARQNYDGSLSKDTRELSSFPILSKSDFHRYEEYFKLETKKPR